VAVYFNKNVTNDLIYFLCVCVHPRGTVVECRLLPTDRFSCNTELSCCRMLLACCSSDLVLCRNDILNAM